jgi:hypothetical protein
LSLRPEHRLDDRLAQFRALILVAFDKRQNRIGADCEVVSFSASASVSSIGAGAFNSFASLSSNPIASAAASAAIPPPSAR